MRGLCSCDESGRSGRQEFVGSAFEALAIGPDGDRLLNGQLASHNPSGQGVYGPQVRFNRMLPSISLLTKRQGGVSILVPSPDYCQVHSTASIRIRRTAFWTGFSVITLEAAHLGEASSRPILRFSIRRLPWNTRSKDEAPHSQSFIPQVHRFPFSSVIIPHPLPTPNTTQ